MKMDLNSFDLFFNFFSLSFLISESPNSLALAPFSNGVSLRKGSCQQFFHII